MPLECVTEPPKCLILKKIEGSATMNIEIHQPELESFIQQPMQSGAFRSVEDFLMQALITAAPAHDPGESRETPVPFWKTFTNEVHALPDDVFNRLPADGASEHDHYLYGSPKRNA
jgi:hypothetical protein